MQTKKLGNSDLNITRIGLGAWAIGGAGWGEFKGFGWGPQDDDDSINTIRYAIDSGINWIDTAAVYGFGHSEEVVGRALKGMSERPYVFTKCSITWDEQGDITNTIREQSVRKEVEESLRRLQLDVIDLYQIHWPNPDEDIEEGWATLKKLQDEGKIRYGGISNFSVSQMERVGSIAPITSLQPPYSIVKQKVAEEILPYCGEHNIGVIVYSPMYAGMLTGKMTRERISGMPSDDWRSNNDEFKEPKLTRNLAIQDLLVEIAAEHGCSTPEVAIAWTLHNPNVTGAIVGARRPDQIDGFINATDVQLTDADMERIAAQVNGSA